MTVLVTVDSSSRCPILEGDACPPTCLQDLQDQMNDKYVIDVERILTFRVSQTRRRSKSFGDEPLLCPNCTLEQP